MPHRRLATALAVFAVFTFPNAVDAQDSCAVLTTTTSLSREESDAEARRTIAEARRAADDYDKCRTLALGINQTRSVSTANLLFEAATSLRGEYELAEILSSAAARGLLEERTAVAYFAAVGSLEDDFQHARALGAALRAGATKPAIVQAILRSATGIQDDYQLASVLVAVARAAPVTAETRELYGAAARTLQNRWEYRRAMGALN